MYRFLLLNQINRINRNTVSNSANLRNYTHINSYKNKI